MLTIIFEMLEDLGIFIVLWFLLLLIFSSSGFIIFNELDAYKSLYSVLIVHFESSLGNWALKIYDGLSLDDRTGEVFHLISVIINMILMLNLVIAILSETYARLAPQRLGLYYDGLIASMPGYQFDRRFGILILIPPPLNVIVIFPTLIFVCFLNNDQYLKNINKVCVIIGFTPFAIVYTACFMAFNLILIPFAWLRGFIHKITEVTQGCCSKKRKGHEDLSPNSSPTDLLIFGLLGVPMLFCSQFVDVYFFVKHLYTWKASKLTNEKIKSVDYHSFVILENVIKSTIKEVQTRKLMSMKDSAE
jgi:hypothetical protein